MCVRVGQLHRRASLLPILLAILAVPVACGGREAAPAPAPAPEPMAIDRGWERAMDPAGEGVRRGWPTGTFAGTPVQLPDVANAEPGDPETGVAWYRTTVAAPANGEWRLRFGSAHFDATVWVYGRRLGSHRGAY